MRLFFILFITFIFSGAAYGFPVGDYVSLDEPLSIISSEEDYDFNGIVAMNNCSAALVHFEGQPKSSKGYVLTNGHCTGGIFGGFPDPGEVIVNKRDFRSMNAHIDINDRVRIRTETLVYATMTGTDAALFRISSTYEDLEKRGVHSFEMAGERPDLDEEIQIVSGYWRKGFTCQIESFIHELRESDWVMKDSIRYSDPGCEVYGGTSGSPVIRKGERVVVAVNNTGNESGGRCTMNNPCEVDKDGNVSIIEGRGYAQQTYWFATCMDDQYNLDLDKTGCLLPKP